MDTAFVQTSLKEGHSESSYQYMERVRDRLSKEMPELSTYFQAGGLVDGVINQGLPAPIDIQIKSQNMERSYALAEDIAAQGAQNRVDLEIHDRVGGGDGFASGLIYGFLTGQTAQWAVECGAAHGALAMTTPGDTTMATLPEVLHLMKGKSARIVR